MICKECQQELFRLSCTTTYVDIQQILKTILLFHSVQCHSGTWQNSWNSYEFMQLSQLVAAYTRPKTSLFFLFSISLPPFIYLWNQFFQFSSPKFSISQALFPDTFPSCLKGNLTWEISSVYNIVPNVRAFIHKFVTMFTTQYSNPPKVTQIYTVNFTGCESRGLPRAVLCWSRLFCLHLALCKFNLVSPNLRNVRPGPQEKEKNGFFSSEKIMYFAK